MCQVPTEAYRYRLRQYMNPSTATNARTTPTSSGQCRKITA